MRGPLASKQERIANLSGYMPAIPTPFDEAGNLDEAALEHFCERQVDKGARALVVCGTTGEAPTLTRDEYRKVIRTAVDASGGKVPIIAGAGSNSTEHAIELALNAEDAGADAILSVVPYYNKPNQRGLCGHFIAIMDRTALPLVLYDVPSRTVCGLADETVVQLAAHRRCAGLKDATGDVSRPLRLRPRLKPGFRLFSGDDATALGFFAAGGDGCISVTSNVAPGLCQGMYLALVGGQPAVAQFLATLVEKLTAGLFSETNPVATKCALNLLGLMSARVRLPLVEAQEETRAEIARLLSQLADECPDCLIAKPIATPRRVSVRATAN
jgi:4-hydroxy-tetrahydrodipicolinate synthase